MASHNLYRNALEELSRGSADSENAVAARAVALADARRRSNCVDKDPGHFLIGSGRPDLETAIDFVPPVETRLASKLREAGIELYVLIIAILALVLAQLPLIGLRVAPWRLTATLIADALVLTLETATAMTKRAMASLLPPRIIPALKLVDGVEAAQRTLVVIPILLSSREQVLTAIADLEIHHLTAREDEIHYALLSDFRDAASESLPGEGDVLIGANAAIAALSARHPAPDGQARFLFLHRRPQYNPPEGCWMAWERKRGKLNELNRLLRGALDTSYYALDGGAPAVPAGTRYVITLDSYGARSAPPSARR